MPNERKFNPKLLIVGALGGFVGGFFGVGGGIILVPLILWILTKDRHIAHATSLAAIIIIATFGMIGFAVDGNVDPGVGIALGLGGVVGATIGANLMHRLSPSTLKIVFSIVLIASGLRMVIS